MGTGYRYTIKTLWGLAKSKELGLTEEELHLLVARETGKDSIRELNRSELSHICHALSLPCLFHSVSLKPSTHPSQYRAVRIRQSSSVSTDR